MTIPRKHFTVEDYMQLPGDQRYELLEGELVMTPAPTSRHQQILLRLAATLHGFTYDRGLGAVYPAPTDVVLSPKTVLQPDLLFVRRDRQSIVDPEGPVNGAPDLVLEILSPSTAKRDLEEKRQIYSQHGVKEYWIVDPAVKNVEVLTQQGAGLETWQRFTHDTTLTSPLLTGLQLALASVFAD
jgi:Uma2 family endonuclease